jgi:putative oxidoreductase
MNALFSLHRQVFSLVETMLLPIATLITRLYLGKVFLKAGYSRIVNWDSQEFLFADIHPVPFLPTSLAAQVTTIGEISLGILFILGLFGRLSAVGLLVMTMMIQFVVAQTPQGMENCIGNPEHYLWMMMFLLMAAIGPGKISVDNFLAPKLGY